MNNTPAVVGDRDSIILFKALGFNTYFAETYDEIIDCLRKLVKEDTSIIFITEEVAQKIPNVLEQYAAKPFPVIIPIPDKSGATDVGLERIRANVERAIGTDILN